MQGVILYGPPASGKDTVTLALTALNSTYRHFPRLKVGTGRTAGYRMASIDQLQALRAAGEVIWENHRYGATYVVDQPFLISMLARCVPILHLGQVEAVEHVTRRFRHVAWTVAELWCAWPVAEARIASRATEDDLQRAIVWAETRRLTSADVRLDTSLVTPTEAARTIDRRAIESRQPRSL